MKRFLTAVLLLACLSPLTQAAEKIKELVIHPGETLYARFEATAKKITLIQVSKEPDDQAQVIYSLEHDTEKKLLKLRVENKFPRDLIYRAEIRLLKEKRQFPMRVTPVVGGKLAFESLPNAIEEIAVFDFKLQK